MKKVKRKLTLFLVNYALIPLILIAGIITIFAFLIPGQGNIQEAVMASWPIAITLTILFNAFFLWAIAQAITTIVFLFMGKKIDVIAPSIIIAGLVIATILMMAVPYVSPDIFIKILSIALLAYIMAVGYSYKRLKIKLLAKLK